MEKTIGRVTLYRGTEHGYLNGHTVRIVAVIKFKEPHEKGLVREEEYNYIDDEAALREAGGVSAHDRLDVVPWIEGKSRYSFVSSDARAVDLELFAHLEKDAVT